MEYVALLRARRVLVWYGGIVAAVLLLILYGIATHSGSTVVKVDGHHPNVPLADLIAGAAFASVVVASFLAGGLDAEYKTAAITFTRPLPRLQIAHRYAAVAALTAVAATAITALALFVGLAAANALPYVTFTHVTDLAYVATIFGAAVMWYGLVVLVAALFPGRGQLIVGLSWAFTLIVPGIAQGFQRPEVLHAVFGALQYLDPLAYVGEIGPAGNRSPLGFSSEARAALAWAIGLAAYAAGTILWSRREVSS